MVAFITEYGLFEKVVARYGISHDNSNVIEENNLRYDTCLELSDSINPKGEVSKKQISSL